MFRPAKRTNPANANLTYNAALEQFRQIARLHEKAAQQAKHARRTRRAVRAQRLEAQPHVSQKRHPQLPVDRFGVVPEEDGRLQSLIEAAHFSPPVRGAGRTPTQSRRASWWSGDGMAEWDSFSQPGRRGEINGRARKPLLCRGK